MGLEDKFDAAGDKIKGKVEEAVGKATDDDSKVLKGKAEQAKGSLKDTAADIKAHVKETAEERRADSDDGRPAPRGEAAG
ncbi:CsbD family protein [Sinomonas terrae]|uniref:CsbD family protein n=1 Tax=Sinomonas terrae TaxID=2908838 RepID=A0ABS9U4H2_9MICC|nr:CsbD family protein [Sinomonas terrae]MCH6471175.1 CsbD family protein [Sinomonas terrae]